MKSIRGSLRWSGALAPALIVGLAGCTNLPLAPTAVIPPSPMMAGFRAMGSFEPPVAKTTVASEFPFELRCLGLSGLVKIDCLIDTDCLVSDPKIVESSFDELNAPALAAVIRWTFEPGRRDGRAVPTRATIPLKFSLSP